MKRAVVVYVDQNREQLLYFGCLYTSFKYIKSPDTELIVFAPNEVHPLLPSDIKKIAFRGTFPHYPYLHAMEYLLDQKANVLDQYDFILRTEPDTFLTPAWNSFTPTSFTTGKGKYVISLEVENKIRQIASELGFTHNGLYNIGASHYGPPSLIREVCKFSIQIATYLLDYEFHKSEGSWPGWYRGVISMYSNEIAVNHVVEEFDIDDEQLDYDSTSASHILQHAHIHCWHTTKLFSKFMFATNKYNRFSLLNRTSVRDYCLYIALKSVEELAIQKSLLTMAD